MLYLDVINEMTRLIKTIKKILNGDMSLNRDEIKSFLDEFLEDVGFLQGYICCLKEQIKDD